MDSRRRRFFGLAGGAVTFPFVPLRAHAQMRFADGTITVNGLRLPYPSWGHPARPPMILLPGIGRHAHSFDHIAPDYARDYHVIALDMRGHGDSAWTPDAAYLVEDFTKDLEAFIPALNLRGVTLHGNSTGGRVAQVYAGLHPDNVERLIVEDVGPERPRDVADNFPRRVEQEKNGWGSEDELLRELLARNKRTPEPILRNYVHFGLKRRDDGRLVWKFDPNLVKGFVETELWQYVSKITSPTIYVLGGASRIVPPETAARLKATLPRCEVVTMPGLGHYPNEEDTAGFLAHANRFLGRS